jgi:hypothetical protein
MAASDNSSPFLFRQFEIGAVALSLEIGQLTAAASVCKSIHASP